MDGRASPAGAVLAILRPCKGQRRGSATAAGTRRSSAPPAAPASRSASAPAPTPTSRAIRACRCASAAAMSAAMARRAVPALLALLLIALAACAGDQSGGSSAATTSSTERWRPLHDAILSRTEVGAARVGHFIYVVGGLLPNGQTTATVEGYNIERDRWARVASMPIAVNHPAVTSLKGRVFVYGGYLNSEFGAVTGAM